MSINNTLKRVKCIQDFIDAHDGDTLIDICIIFRDF